MAVMHLPEVLDLRAAGELRTLILSHKGIDLTLDASEVTRLGGLCLQVLLAARQAWVLDRKKFQIVNVSPNCRDALTLAHATAALGLED